MNYALRAVVASCALLMGCPDSKIITVLPDGYVASDTPADDPEDTAKLLPPGHCQPSALLGCTSNYSYKQCNAIGDGFQEIKCGNGELCFGAGECKAAICVPGSKKCFGPVTVSICAEDGSKFVPQQPCDLGLVCDASGNSAQCVSSCAGLGKATSNVGCGYAVVDLGNYESDPKNNLVDRPVMLVVSNTSGNKDARINIRSTLNNATLPFSDEELTVPPQQLKTYLLPTGQGQLTTAINDWSWVVTSDQPVTAHMFNPENGPDVRSNDATLLFPNDAVGKEYQIMGWRSFYTDAQGRGTDGYPKYGFDSYITIVAVEDGETLVNVKPTASIRPGTNKEGKPILRIQAGEQASFTLKQWQVLTLAVEPALAEMDLTGSSVWSEKNLAVFTAHNCAFVPNIDVKYCDHLEHQLAPTPTWGSTYAADLFHPRAPGAYDVWRVMASQNETTITTNPPIPGVGTKVLNAGEWFEYQAGVSHMIQAVVPGGEKARIQVGHYMTGSNIPGFDPVCGDALTGIGDPAFTIGVAVNQYIDNYVVLTPPGYSDDYLNIVRKTGTTVMLDDKPLETKGVPMGDTGYEMVRLSVEDGVHRLKSTDGSRFGVTAYGYDCDVSYAYPGGMLLTSQ